jgi:N-methylhydantoinase A/oxoprolinase/acetone carboxylase beta subunit
LKLILGIDAGGTYTDTVLLDPASGLVQRKAKALTTPRDLSLGIAEAIATIARLEGPDLTHVGLVSISTTLATNAIVEEHGGRVGLLLVGCDQEIMRRSGLEGRLPVEGLFYLRGGHDVKGDEVCPLDAEAARQAILALRDRVDAFAVSGYFSVMNPEHELQVRGIIAELTDAPVVCGHELTSRLNSLKRVSTAVLNARLLPVLRRLLDSVKQVLVEQGITAPLMVVKGDGSLIGEEIARRRPVETILSGPAASAIGGQYLAGENSAIVVDMGGTTTDIAVLRDGLPWTNPAGAMVGGWQTSVRAADLRTIGLGGDSHIRVERGHTLRVGPRRALPLCRLGMEHPEIVPELEGAMHAGAGERSTQPTDFLTIVRRPRNVTLTSDEESLLTALANGPLSITHLRYSLDKRRQSSERLEAWGVLRRAGLTPTDLLLVTSGSAEGPGSPGMTGNQAAALAGARVVAHQLGLAVGDLVQQVMEHVVDRVVQEILDKLVTDETGHSLFPAPPSWEFLLQRVLGHGEAGALDCRVQVLQPIVAIGAPVAGFMPQVATKLHTRCLIPEHAEVGNAVGAVVASVTHTVEILVQPHVVGAGTLTFLVHSPRGRERFPHFPEAVARAEELAVELAQGAVRQAGAEGISVKVDRQEVVLGKLSEMTVRACASGRPRLEMSK